MTVHNDGEREQSDMSKYGICQMGCMAYSDTPCRLFVQMSCVSFGCGSESRGAQFIVSQCVHLLYALRCAYLSHCLETMQKTLVHVPQELSNLFLNSNKQNAFSALQNIKRPANLCIEHDDRQNVTWIGFRGDSLNVHSGVQGLERIPVSHQDLRNTFHALCRCIVGLLREMGITLLTWRQFTDEVKDSTSCKTPGMGMGVFNPGMKIEVRHGFDRESRLSWMFKAAKVYRLALAANHLCGGPSPRGTETAVTRLLNSPTGLYRNVQKLGSTLGVEGGYKKSRNLTSKTSAIGIVVKFLPIPFAVILATIILRVKPVEADFSKLETQVTNLETLSYLHTEYGDPVNPVRMAETLSNTWQEVGFQVRFGDLRHALEAFAHKMQPNVGGPTTQQHVFANLANHNLQSSAGYGRDENCFGGVPADITEQNSAACYMWNTRILQSPSAITEQGLLMLQQQLREFGMLGEGDMSLLEAIAQGQSQPSGMGLDMMQQVRDGLGAFCYYICVTLYQASSIGTGGGAAFSPTNVPSASLSARTQQESLSAVSAVFVQHTPSPVQLAAQGNSQIVRFLI